MFFERVSLSVETRMPLLPGKSRSTLTKRLFASHAPRLQMALLHLLGVVHGRCCAVASAAQILP
jgi:hypothetical protein